MKKSTQKVMAGFASLGLMATLALTACSSASDGPKDTDTKPVATSQQATTQKPSEGTESKKDKAEKPKPTETLDQEAIQKKMDEKYGSASDSINFKKSYDDYGDKQSIEKIFPTKDFDIEAGVKTGLRFMDDVIQTQNIYEPREKGADKTTFGSSDFTDRMTGSFIKRVNEDIDKNGYTRGMVPAANLKGVVGTTTNKGKTIELKANKALPVLNSWNEPAISADTYQDEKHDKDIHDVLVVRGERTVQFNFMDDRQAHGKITYTVWMVPDGDGWLVDGITYENYKLKVSGEGTGRE